MTQALTGFQLDTSGEVVGLSADGLRIAKRWSDLSPFVQGYVDALLEACWRREYGVAAANDRCFGWKAAFSDLAPETLARIIEDCDAYPLLFPSQGPATAYLGACFWADRQAGRCPNFPPLTVSLNDDGKVVFQ
jgi:hypothetical protein